MRKLVAWSSAIAFTLAISPQGLLALAAPANGATVSSRQANGQNTQNTGVIQGTATDNSKQPFKCKKVRLVDANGVIRTEVECAAGGAFIFTNVPPGTYSVQVLTSTLVNNVATDTVVGTTSVTVAAGTVATISVATTVAAAIAAASAGGGILAGTTLLIVGGLVAGGAVAYAELKPSSNNAAPAAQNQSSPSF